jgi:hypothetical protein
VLDDKNLFTLDESAITGITSVDNPSIISDKLLIVDVSEGIDLHTLKVLDIVPSM